MAHHTLSHTLKRTVGKPVTHCAVCAQPIVRATDSLGTGYARLPAEDGIDIIACYSCADTAQRLDIARAAIGATVCAHVVLGLPRGPTVLS